MRTRATAVSAGVRGRENELACQSEGKLTREPSAHERGVEVGDEVDDAGTIDVGECRGGV